MFLMLRGCHDPPHVDHFQIALSSESVVLTSGPSSRGRFEGVTGGSDDDVARDCEVTRRSISPSAMLLTVVNAVDWNDFALSQMFRFTYCISNDLVCVSSAPHVL